MAANPWEANMGDLPVVLGYLRLGAFPELLSGGFLSVESGEHPAAGHFTLAHINRAHTDTRLYQRLETEWRIGLNRPDSSNLKDFN